MSSCEQSIQIPNTKRKSIKKKQGDKFIPDLRVRYRFSELNQKEIDYAANQGEKINNLMDYLQQQKLEYKDFKYKQKEHIEKQKLIHLRKDEIKFSGGFPKHTGEFRKHLHPKETFIEQKFLPIPKEEPKKTKQDYQNSEFRPDGTYANKKSWNHTNQLPEMFDKENSSFKKPTYFMYDENKTFTPQEAQNFSRRISTTQIKNRSLLGPQPNYQENQQNNIQNNKYNIKISDLNNVNQNQKQVTINMKNSRNTARAVSSTKQKFDQNNKRGSTGYSKPSTTNRGLSSGGGYQTAITKSSQKNDQSRINSSFLSNNKKHQKQIDNQWKYSSHIQHQNYFNVQPNDNYYVKLKDREKRVQTAFNPTKTKPQLFGKYEGTLEKHKFVEPMETKILEKDFKSLNCDDFDSIRYF